MSDTLKNKLDGQIWIEKNAPYKLKYHTAGKDFAIETSEEYSLSKNNSPEVGDLVKVNSKGELEKASFPLDLRNVIGMLVSNQGVVSTSGYVEISKGKISNNSDVGDTLYWYGNTYTTSTPNSNIKYINLPTIGKIVKVGTNSNKVTVHLNIAPFDNSIEWYVTGTPVEGVLSVMHGLKEYSSYQLSLAVSGGDNPYHTAYCDCSDNGNGTSTFNIKCINTFNYKASGVVIYG